MGEVPRAGVPNGCATREARWLREEPRRTVPPDLLTRMVHTAFPRGHVLEMQSLTDGWRNANFKLRLDCTAEPIVLRIYEHDASLCQKEVDLIGLVGSSVPVPEVIHAEASGGEDIGPFLLMRYVEGISFRELKRSGDARAISEAAYSTGETLAAIGRTTFGKAGWLAPGPKVAEPLLEGADATPRFVDLCLASEHLQQRVNEELREEVHSLVWSWAKRLAELDEETRLVHGDFGKRNLLVRNGEEGWRVVAVLDWEFAISGSPLADVGHFLRYEKAARPVFEPHFSEGYVQGGGRLPEDWRRVAQVVELTALCESLTREELPSETVVELVELIRATVKS